MSQPNKALVSKYWIHIVASLLIGVILWLSWQGDHSPTGDLGRLLSKALSTNLEEALLSSQPHPPLSSLVLWFVAPVLSWKNILILGSSLCLLSLWFGLWKLNRIWGNQPDHCALAAFAILCGSGWLWASTFNLHLDLFGAPLILMLLWLTTPTQHRHGALVGAAGAGIILVKYSFAFFVVPALIGWAWDYRKEKLKIAWAVGTLIAILALWALTANPSPFNYLINSLRGSVDTESSGNSDPFFFMWAWKTGFGWIGLLSLVSIRKGIVPMSTATCIIGSIAGLSLIPLQEIRYLLPMAAPATLWICRSRSNWKWIWFLIGGISTIGQASHHISTKAAPSWRPMTIQAQWEWHWPYPHKAYQMTDSLWKGLDDRAKWIHMNLPKDVEEIIWIQRPHPERALPEDQLYFIKQYRPNLFAIIPRSSDQIRSLLTRDASRWAISVGPSTEHALLRERKWELRVSDEENSSMIGIWKAK